MKTLCLMKKFLFLCFFLLNSFTVSAQESFAIDPTQIKHLSGMSIYGGSFWEGYTTCHVDITKKVLTATWDQRHMDRGGELERHTGSKNLTKEEMELILQSLIAMDKISTEEGCAIAADGPEESLVLTFDNQENPLRLVNERSRIFVCGDHYVSNESFDKFRSVLKGIYPEAFPAN